MAKQVKKKDRREQIKVAALGLFAEHGYHGTSTEMIIAKAGVSKGLLFFHFKNKEELLKRLTYEWLDQLWNELVPEMDDNKEAIECLSELIDYIYDSLVKYELHYRLHYSLLLTDHPISSRSKLQKLMGYNRLQEYLQWIFKRLGAKDVEGEVRLFSNEMLGAEMNFLIVRSQRTAQFNKIKKMILRRY